MPIIKKGEEIYYPIAYFWSKVLLRKSTITKVQKTKYADQILMMNVDFTFMNAGFQETYCCTKDLLIKFMKNSEINRLTHEQKERLNSTLRYFGEEGMPIKERFIYEDSINLNKYSEYAKDIIDHHKDSIKGVRWQRCNKCDTYYPHTIDFFNYDEYMVDNLTSNCKECIYGSFKHLSSELQKIYKQYGDKIYKLCNSNNIMVVYELYRKYEDKNFLKLIDSKEKYLLILQHLYDNNYINKDNLTLDVLKEEYKLNDIREYLDIEEIYYHFYKDHPRQYPWHYKKYNLRNLQKDEANIIFKNYLKEKGLIIEDIYSFNYSEAITKCCLQNYASRDILQFTMDFYNNKYPSYKFNISSINYWKRKENRFNALRYLIEVDLGIPIEKVPLYLTKNILRKTSRTMYHLLHKYYKSLFEWINEVYPGKFIETDFNISFIRNEFDSLEEQRLHEILTGRFKNVIYNNRNMESTINIDGMIPDWLIFTDDHCWVVEYFGLITSRDTNNKRIADYREKTKKKIKQYKKLKGYNYLFLFPIDLNNEQLLNMKLSKIG